MLVQRKTRETLDKKRNKLLVRRQRRRVAWNAYKQPPPQHLIPSFTTQNPITSTPSYTLSSSQHRINIFQAMLPEIVQPPELLTPPPHPPQPPPKYTKSSKHFFDGKADDDDGTVDEYIDKKFYKNYPYSDNVLRVVGEAAAAIDDNVGIDEVKRSQMNQNENSVPKIRFFLNENCFHLNEYNFSRSTIQFLGALCQQGKIQYFSIIPFHHPM